MKKAKSVLRASGINLDKIITMIPDIDGETFQTARDAYDASRGGRGSKARGRKDGSKNRGRLIFGHGSAQNEKNDALMSLALIVASDAVTRAGEWREDFPSYGKMRTWFERDVTKALKTGLIVDALGAASGKDRAVALEALDGIRQPRGAFGPTIPTGRPIVNAQATEPTANIAAGLAPEWSIDYDEAKIIASSIPFEVVAGRAKYLGAE